MATLNRDVAKGILDPEKYFMVNFPQKLFGVARKAIRGHKIFELLRGKLNNEYTFNRVFTLIMFYYLQRAGVLRLRTIRHLNNLLKCK